MSKSTYDAIAKFIGQNDKRLIAQVLNGLDFAKQVRVMRNASLNGTGLQKLTVQKGIRPSNTSVDTRAGNHRSFSGRKLLVYTGMKIIEIIPEEAERTWMSDMLEPGVKQIPFAEWVWQQEYNKIASEINDSIFSSTYKGDATEWDAGATYTANVDYKTYGPDQDIYKCISNTTAGQSPDTNPSKWLKVNEAVISEGWGTIITNEISNSAIVPVTTGAFSDSNALDKVELMYKAMPVAHQNLGGQFLMAPDVYRSYLSHEKSEFPNAATPGTANGKKYVWGSDDNWEIVKATWMSGSQRVIATQKDNLAFGTNLEGDSGKVAKTIETLHGTKSVVKWYQGCEIADLETLYANDQA